MQRASQLNISITLLNHTHSHGVSSESDRTYRGDTSESTEQEQILNDQLQQSSRDMLNKDLEGKGLLMSGNKKSCICW